MMLIFPLHWKIIGCFNIIQKYELKETVTQLNSQCEAKSPMIPYCVSNTQSMLFLKSKEFNQDAEIQLYPQESHRTPLKSRDLAMTLNFHFIVVSSGKYIKSPCFSILHDPVSNQQGDGEDII